MPITKIDEIFHRQERAMELMDVHLINSDITETNGSTHSTPSIITRCLSIIDSTGVSSEILIKFPLKPSRNNKPTTVATDQWTLDRESLLSAEDSTNSRTALKVRRSLPTNVL